MDKLRGKSLSRAKKAVKGVEVQDTCRRGSSLTPGASGQVSGKK